MTLKDLPLGKAGRILKVGGNGELRQHFLDMGIIPATVVRKIKLAPMGDPVEIDVSGYELTMRLADAEKIEV
ncbi:MAG: FeoA domain-containing protein, partial [Treponema sp.]|nr:FeoA domain-containing protein [Treponema sp.]